MKNIDIHNIAKEFDPIRLGKRANALADKMEKEKISLKEAAGITDAMEHEIYGLGKHYYDSGKYTEAVTIFEALCRISPNNYWYIYGLASAHHQAQDYINASIGFYTAFTIDPTNPLNTFYLADCFVHLDAKNDAARYLDLTIAISESSKDKYYLALAERCKLIKSGLLSKNSPITQ